ncbi:hypothetical protein GA0070609_6561 [Micromonospora echinaurantiaca]|uniref:Apea-like HEPN domain-containing protein n=2 Tax=Micromonospora echinaurantiaca TaxID=47857 RepID=A0A1C5KDF3_9ACTN|nr:hypothetical protein GA0070609_6561 [Micromonospora echinaurantiaca]
MAAGIEADWSERFRENGESIKNLTLHLPNGREKRRLPIVPRSAADFLQGNFESWTFLSEYLAFLDRKDQVIEAFVRPAASGMRWLPQDLPGAVQTSGDPPVTEVDSPEEFSAELANRPTMHIDSDKPWKLPIEGSTIYEVELSPPSPGMQGLEIIRYRRPPSLNRSTTLKIRNVKLERHDDAVTLLESLSGALFFEVDLLYGGLFQLVRFDRDVPIWSRQPKGTTTKLRLPKVQYAQEATALYEYGRTAVGTPLLEFQAFYQVIEYFFPLFSRAETLRRLRRQLSDPRFDLHDESHLNQVLAIASQSPRGFGGEREQLKDTLDAVVEDSELREFIKADEDREKFLTEGKKIKDVTVINLLDAGNRLSRQAADRVYDIRCRVVHTKEDGGKSGAKMIVPGSRESKLLQHDIELVQFLAQKAIIAGSRRAPW